MFQLRNLIGRINVTNPKARFDEYVVLVVLASVMTNLKMTSLCDSPTSVPCDVWLKTKEERKYISLAVVKEFVDFKFFAAKSKDLVKSHSIELLSLGLFYLNFRRPKSVYKLEVHVAYLYRYKKEELCQGSTSYDF